jgi:hypothetical protein
MGYQDIKGGIAKMLVAKGFAESGQVFNFKDESDASISKKFRIERPEVDLEAEGVEFLNDIVRPVFIFNVALGFKIGTEKQTFDYDVSQNLIDTIIAYFNHPTNYTTFCIKMKTTKITTELIDDHLEALIRLEVLDNITLA